MLADKNFSNSPTNFLCYTLSNADDRHTRFCLHAYFYFHNLIDRVVDLTTDEYETEQHMLQEVVNISTMNANSPNAPPFSPLTPRSPEVM